MSEVSGIRSPSQISAHSVEIGSPMTITIEASFWEAFHDVEYQFRETKGTIESDTVAKTFEWTPPMSLCSEMTDALSDTLILRCRTYFEHRLVGTRETEVTLSIPDEVGLTLNDGWATIVPHNEETAFEDFPVLVQGSSKAQLVIDESKISTENAYGALLAEYEVRYAGEAVDAEFCTPVLYGTRVNFLCSVTDTRGRQRTFSFSKSVYPYAKPTLSEIAIYRCDSDGNGDEGGSALAVYAECGISKLGGVNEGTMQVQYRAMNDGYGDGVAVNSGEKAVLWDGQLSPRQTYQVRLECVDTIGNTAAVTVMIPTDEVFFHGRSGGKGAAFGKYAETDNLLDVEWDLKTGGRLTVSGDADIGGMVTLGGKSLWDYLMPVGYIYISADPTSPAELFGGTWEQLKDVFLLAAGGVYPVDSAGGAARVQLTEAQLPNIRATFPHVSYGQNKVSGYASLQEDWPTEHYQGENDDAKNTKYYLLNFGQDQPHENMPPYVAKYIWQRVA